MMALPLSLANRLRGRRLEDGTRSDSSRAGVAEPPEFQENPDVREVSERPVPRQALETSQADHPS